jgi:hypothetical protein
MQSHSLHGPTLISDTGFRRPGHVEGALVGDTRGLDFAVGRHHRCEIDRKGAALGLTRLSHGLLTVGVPHRYRALCDEKVHFCGKRDVVSAGLGDRGGTGIGNRDGERLRYLLLGSGGVL